MFKYHYLFLIVTCCCLIACKKTGSNDGSTSTSNSSSSTQKDAKGVEYVVHTNNGGEKAKVGDFVTMHMRYTTINDSIIFTSYTRPKPLSFKLQPTLFKGVLNEGLTKMAAGDSATFYVPADTLYGERIPRFAKSGDKIKYTISLKKVQSQQEYQAEQKSQRDSQLTADKTVIDTYIKANTLKTTAHRSGVHYIVNKEGTGNPADLQATLMAKYKVSYIDGKTLKEVEDNTAEAKEMVLTRQVTGIRQSVEFLKKGSKTSLIIPSVLAYRDRSRGKIPANAVLVYDIEVTDIKTKK